MIKQIIHKITDPSQNYRVRLFYVLAMSGIAISAVALIDNITLGMVYASILCTIMMLISIGVLLLAYITQKQKLSCIITVIAIFMVFFPLIFFLEGGYKSGTPSLFMFGVIFTVLMMEGKASLVFAFLEIIEYLNISLIAYYHPETVIKYYSEQGLVHDILLCFCLMGSVCAIALYYHLKAYDKQKAQLFEQNEKLKQYDASRSTFLTTVSHEVRNPLNAINLHARDTADLLEEAPIDFKLIRENQEIIMNMVTRIDKILMDLNDTVAIEQGRVSLSLEEYRMQRLLQETVEYYFNRDNEQNNEIALELDENLPPITLDYARIVQVVTNLLGNSMQHTENGKITVSLTGEDGKQLICIADTGEGMTKEIEAKVLEGYVSTNKDYWRHGIGLFVCNRIIEAHGGEIWIDSKLGEGTKVYFTLPYVEAENMGNEITNGNRN